MFLIISEQNQIKAARKIYEVTWYEFESNESKKLLQMMIADFQESIEIKILKIMKVNLELFI